MNKKLLIIIISIAVLIVVSVAYVILRPEGDTASSEIPMATRQDASSANAPAAADGRRGTYATYSENSIANTAGTKILFFHAPWCPQCRQIEESINQSGIPTGVTVIKVDYDSNQALRKQYGVTLQTTFVKINDAGNKITSYVAYEEPQFSSVERELLP